MFNPIISLMLSYPTVFEPFDVSQFADHTRETGQDMDPIKPLIIQIAKQYGLNPNWVCAIILRESSGFKYHIRYEPSYRDLYHPEVFAKNLRISLDTEMEAQKISWGLGQVMGALAREQGHVGLMAELVDPALNIKHICIRLRNLKKYSLNASDIFGMYNGGPGVLMKKENGKLPNQDYVDGIWTLMKNNLIIE